MRGLLVVILTACAWAQCPVQINDVHTAPGLIPNPPQLRIKWTNTSDKTVVAVKFSVFFTDAVGDRHPAVFSYIAEQKATSHSTKTKRWDHTETQMYGLKPGASVEKVRFENGSTWQDDGTKVCTYTSAK